MVFPLRCTQRSETKYFRSPKLKEMHLLEEATSPLHSPLHHREEADPETVPTAFTEGPRQVGRSDLQAAEGVVTLRQVTPEVGWRGCANMDLLTTRTPSYGVPIQQCGSPTGPSKISLLLLGPQIRIQPIRPVTTRGTLTNWAELRVAVCCVQQQEPRRRRPARCYAAERTRCTNMAGLTQRTAEQVLLAGVGASVGGEHPR